jgi:hypothetical protein
MGEAAGTAAAMASLANQNVADLDVKKLQAQLVKQGVYLGDQYK